MYLKRMGKVVAGKKVTYLAIAQNVHRRKSKRADGRMGHSGAHPIQVLGLGREGNVDPEEAELALQMAQLLYDRAVAKGKRPEQAATEARERMQQWLGRQQVSEARPVETLESRQLGMRPLLEAVWDDLGIRQALVEFAGRHTLDVDFERLVFCMVWNRLVDPQSKLAAANHWAADLAYMPEGAGWQVQHFYRVMDLLHGHWRELEDLLHDRLAAITPEKLRGMTLVDTTNFHFETDFSDEERLDRARAEAARTDALVGESLDGTDGRSLGKEVVPLRMRGKNKDGHDRDPQVVLLSAVSLSGHVLRHRVFPGNTNDATIAREVIPELAPMQGDYRVWVSDAGFKGKDQRQLLHRHGWHWLLADRLRDGGEDVAALLTKPGRYARHPDKPQFSYRTVPVGKQDAGRKEQWVLVRNSKERERQLARLEVMWATVREAVAKADDGQPHGKALCTLASKPGYARLLRKDPADAGRYLADEEGFRQARLAAGTRLLRTSLATWSGREVHDACQMLQQVEANHRELKSPMKLRPCHHRVARRIEAHVMLNLLALNCTRTLEARTGMTMNRIRQAVAPLHATRVRQGQKTWWARTLPGEACIKASQALGWKTMPTQWQS
jgi:hypothetical protein